MNERDYINKILEQVSQKPDIIQQMRDISPDGEREQRSQVLSSSCSESKDEMDLLRKEIADLKRQQGRSERGLERARFIEVMP